MHLDDKQTEMRPNIHLIQIMWLGNCRSQALDIEFWGLSHVSQWRPQLYTDDTLTQMPLRVHSISRLGDFSLFYSAGQVVLRSVSSSLRLAVFVPALTCHDRRWAVWKACGEGEQRDQYHTNMASLSTDASPPQVRAIHSARSALHKLVTCNDRRVTALTREWQLEDGGQAKWRKRDSARMRDGERS
jgi:hypothetical protein